MLSFDVSAIDIVLLILSLVLLSLYVTRKPETRKHETITQVEKTQAVQESPKVTPKVQKQKTQAPQLQGFQSCIHFLGYLKDLPRNTQVPDECFGCPKIMQCLFQSSSE